MSKEPHHTTAKSDFEPLRATRRTALHGAGLASLLALSGASATAQKDFLRSNGSEDQSEMSADDESIPVTWENFPHASCHAGFESTVNAGGFGQFYHMRDLAPIADQFVPGVSRDFLYSWGVFDLTEPVTITLPDSGDRYMSMNVQSEGQYAKMCVYDPGQYTITRDLTETRYAGVLVRTFVDPNDPEDVETVHRLQDELAVGQDSAGTFEIPNWEQQSFKQIDDALRTVVITIDNWSGAYGDVDQVDSVKFFIASASRWTGVPQPSEALFLQTIPTENDGETPYELTVGEDVPVDGFWSVSVYNGEGYFEENEYDAYTVNDVTVEQDDDDGSVTVHFGGDPDQPNFIYTPENWNYMVRFYQPREGILDGSYQFPEAEPLE